jgi:uncharacterized repeat protein (TIGR03803 family)
METAMNTILETTAAETFQSSAPAVRRDALIPGRKRSRQLWLGAVALAGACALGANSAAAAQYWLQYSFLGAPSDGEAASNTLAWGPNGQNANWLYGLTEAGGSGNCSLYGFTGCSTVFGLTPANHPYQGTEDWVATFSSSTGFGDNPQALVDVGGRLYGVTAYGGSNGQGTLYSEPATGGQPTVLYNFCSALNCADGETPTALINVNGTLYGTTRNGGAHGYGMVFSVNLPNTIPNVLYSFNGPSSDGKNPGALTYDGTNNMLYGVASGGGSHAGGMVYGLPIPCNACTDAPLYNFCGRASCTDGEEPNSLYYDAANNTLYGTTYYGGGQGVSVCGGNGCGTVFSLTPAGIEAVLHAFCSQAQCTDGMYPNGLDPDGQDSNGTTGALTALGNNHNKLYGTTYAGGGVTCAAESYQYGCGALFQLTLSGHFRVEHNFPSISTDGVNPYGPLTNVNGTLYGTTWVGGVSGWGTVVAFKP